MTPTDMNNFNDLLDDTIIMLNTIKPTLVPVSSAYQTVTSLSPKPLQVPKFTPGPFDVICARGKQAYNHDGNKHFRGIVSDAIEKYSKEENRLQRSMIVTDIVNAIRERGNGFVRMDGSTGEWIACSDVVCREKVGQYFRSALGCRYKSKNSRSIKKSIKINILPRSDAVRQQQQQQQSVLLSSTKEEEEDSFPPPLLVQGANKERPMGRKKTKKLHRKSTPRKSTRSEASRMLDALEKKNVLNETIHRHRSYQKQANFYLKMGDKVKAQHYMTLLEADQLKCASVPTTVVDTSSLSDDDSGGDKTNDSRFTMDEEDEDDDDEDDDGEVDVRVDNEDKDDDDDDEVIVVTVVDGDGCGDDDDTTTDSESDCDSDSDSDSDEDDEHDHDHNHDDSDMNHDNSNNHKDCDILCF